MAFFGPRKRETGVAVLYATAIHGSEEEAACNWDLENAAVLKRDTHESG